MLPEFLLSVFLLLTFGSTHLCDTQAGLSKLLKTSMCKYFSVQVLPKKNWRQEIRENPPEERKGGTGASQILTVLNLSRHIRQPQMFFKTVNVEVKPGNFGWKMSELMRSFMSSLVWNVGCRKWVITREDRVKCCWLSLDVSSSDWSQRLSVVEIIVFNQV